MNEKIDNLVHSIVELTSFETDSMDRSAVFGIEAYRFEKAQEAMKYSQGLIKLLDPSKFEFMQEQNLNALHQCIDTLVRSATDIMRLEVGESGSERSKLPGLEKAIIDDAIILAEKINRTAFAFSVYSLDGRVKPKLLAEFEEIKTKHKRFNDSIEKANDQLNVSMIGAKNRSDELVAALASKSKRIAEELEQASARISSFEHQTIERLRLNSLSKLWKDKAKQHKLIHTTMSTVVFIAFLFFAQLLVNAFNQTWIDTVVATFAIQGEIKSWHEVFAGMVPKLIAFGLPVGAVIWLMRVFLRLYLSNRVLWEDAEQRSVMLDTYLTLYQEDEVADTDRHLLLNAMFRPLPGESSDIDPPNFTEILTMPKKG